MRIKDNGKLECVSCGCDIYSDFDTNGRGDKMNDGTIEIDPTSYEVEGYFYCADCNPYQWCNVCECYYDSDVYGNSGGYGDCGHVFWEADGGWRGVGCGNYYDYDWYIEDYLVEPAKFFGLKDTISAISNGTFKVSFLHDLERHYAYHWKVTIGDTIHYMRDCDEEPSDDILDGLRELHTIAMCGDEGYGGDVKSNVLNVLNKALNK